MSELEVGFQVLLCSWDFAAFLRWEEELVVTLFQVVEGTIGLSFQLVVKAFV